MAITMCLTHDVCTSEIKNSSKPCAAPTVTYVGRVLATRERNGYHDSDFYAIVWDDEQDQPREIEYASTRGWTYHNHATVDADDATRAKYATWQAVRRAEWERAEEEREALIPRKGKIVRSITTRGKNVGVTGEVRWYGESTYGGMRVGIKVEGNAKLIYMDAARVEVIND